MKSTPLNINVKKKVLVHSLLENNKIFMCISALSVASN